MKENVFSITPSLVMEYLYCPRFIFFMKVLGIPQNEAARYKVKTGRDVHRLRALANKDYLRKKLHVRKKEVEQDLYSEKYSLHGKVDEILFLEDGSAAPLDYKFAEYKGRVYSTYRTQSIMYALLIMENYGVSVSRGFLVFTRSMNYVEELSFTEADFSGLNMLLEKLKRIIMKGHFPGKTTVKTRCIDCCYRNICSR
jgi:CRISPR-associated exonuclease Cas4